MSTPKPLILPYEIVQMLRGERGYTGGSKDIAELAINRYIAGYEGRVYKPPIAPGFPTWSVEMTDRFLLACWKQGRDDAKDKRPVGGIYLSARAARAVSH